MTSAAAAPSAGSVIAGKYRLVAPVAEGGMGVVWRAEDLLLAAPVAVKLLHARNAQDPEARARFESEAALGAQLRSPHVVQIFEMGMDPATDLPFIAMELLEGESLQERLARCGRLSPRELLRIVSQIAQALSRAHALGIIHRDLKPANIFLVRDGETQLAKVLDFGIAKRFAGGTGPARTLTGDLLGTPTYMSPEQIMGSRNVDHRSDLWSLGVIAAECLTGRLPFEGDHLAGLALAICQGRYLLPSGLGPVPEGFDRWFQRAIAPAAEARFDSAAQLVEALRQVCGRADASGAEPFASARAAPGPGATAPLPPASLSPEPTVQLPAPSRVRTRGARRTLLWAAIGAGTLSILIALRIQPPGSAAPSLTTSPGSAVLPSAPSSRAVPSLNAAPSSRAAASIPAIPPPHEALPLPAAVAAAGAPALSAPVRAARGSLPPAAGGAAAQPPRAATGEQRRAAAPRPPAPRPAPAPPPRPEDPDNLGF